MVLSTLHYSSSPSKASNRHPLSEIDSAIKHLTSAMRDPMGANVCSIRMGIAADRIDQALETCDSVSAKTKLAKSHPEFLRAGIKFLTFNQSPEEIETMLEHLIPCRCDFGQKGMRRLHTPRRGGTLSANGLDLLFDAVTAVAQCITLALSELTKHKFRTGKSSNGEQSWPQGPEDLLPFGPKDSVAGLELWVAGPPGTGCTIFKLAGRLATFYAPFAVEVFQYPHFTFPLVRPCHRLKDAITFYHEGDSSPLARDRFFTYPINAIFRFFDNLSDVDTQRFHLMIVARGNLLKPIFTPLTTILSTLPPEWNQVRGFVSYLSSFAYAEPDPETGSVSVKLDVDQFAETVDMLQGAFHMMGTARKMGCWNIQCPSHSEVIHSRLCSRCTLIRFCGEKCQKDAWKYAPLPHKALCAKIYSLKEALGGADWSLLWTPDFTYAQFQAMCRAKNVDTEAVRVIVDEIIDLQNQQRIFVKDLKMAEAQEDRLEMKRKERLACQKALDSLQVPVTASQEATGDNSSHTSSSMGLEQIRQISSW